MASVIITSQIERNPLAPILISLLRFSNLLKYAPVAQWIEQLTSNQQVGGSSPL